MRSWAEIRTHRQTDYELSHYVIYHSRVLKYFVYLTTVRPHETASTMAIQKASVKLVFKNISPSKIVNNKQVIQ